MHDTNGIATLTLQSVLSWQKGSLYVKVSSLEFQTLLRPHRFERLFWGVKGHSCILISRQPKNQRTVQVGPNADSELQFITHKLN